MGFGCKMPLFMPKRGAVALASSELAGLRVAREARDGRIARSRTAIAARSIADARFRAARIAEASCVALNFGLFALVDQRLVGAEAGLCHSAERGP